MATTKHHPGVSPLHQVKETRVGGTHVRLALRVAHLPPFKILMLGTHRGASGPNLSFALNSRLTCNAPGGLLLRVPLTEVGFSLQDKDPDPSCPICDGSGECDSGGTTPWGEGINVRCSCTYTNPQGAA